jgi:hypothetical protein
MAPICCIRLKVSMSIRLFGTLLRKLNLLSDLEQGIQILGL